MGALGPRSTRQQWRCGRTSRMCLWPLLRTRESLSAMTEAQCTKLSMCTSKVPLFFSSWTIWASYCSLPHPSTPETTDIQWQLWIDIELQSIVIGAQVNCVALRVLLLAFGMVLLTLWSWKSQANDKAKNEMYCSMFSWWVFLCWWIRQEIATSCFKHFVFIDTN